MENYWGFQWRRHNGHLYASNSHKVKLTYGQEDGSLVDGYSNSENDYVDMNVTVSGTAGGYQKEMRYNSFGMFLKDVSGSASTYYCDGCWYGNGNKVANYGGNSYSTTEEGAFNVYLDGDINYTYWNTGASVSCRPLEEE